MLNKPVKVIYIKPSSLGVGPVSVNTRGKVLLFVKHPVTTKLLVDFEKSGKAIVPVSSVKIIESE